MKIDVIGHFGTTYSYATVGGRVARALDAAGLLASVTNLDPTWAKEYEGLSGRQPSGTHVIVFAAPRHYFDAFPAKYGRDRAAVFMSPNTDQLTGEYAETCSKFGVAVVPSTYCEDVVRATSTPGEVVRLPLGVDRRYFDLRRRDHPRRRALEVWHFASDQWWPGRKGTQELLEAWDFMDDRGLMMLEAKLHLHVPLALATAAHYTVADMGLAHRIKVHVSELHGSTDEELVACYEGADMIVQPSRCEGFGMMILAALVAGKPLVSTATTGHRDFLLQMPGWVGVPTGGLAVLDAEGGRAPIVDAQALAMTLAMAMSDDGMALLSRGAQIAQSAAAKWTWDEVLPLWTEWAEQWLKETT